MTRPYVPAGMRLPVILEKSRAVPFFASHLLFATGRYFADSVITNRRRLASGSGLYGTVPQTKRQPELPACTVTESVFFPFFTGMLNIWSVGANDLLWLPCSCVLKQLGHRKIARVHFVSPEEVTYHRGQREFLRAAAELNLGDSVRNFQFVEPHTLKSGLLSVLKQGFTAVYMIHQNLAVPAARAILDAGYRIPDDVSLVTYELPEISCHQSPPHTTLDFDYDALARRALEELRLRMLGRAVGGGSVLIPNILTVRGSTGPCRRES